MNDLSDAERESLQGFLADGGNVRSAILKFANSRVLRLNSDCAGAMRTVPRQFELAADYAAKSDVYREFFAELERFAARS